MIIYDLMKYVPITLLSLIQFTTAYIMCDPDTLCLVKNDTDFSVSTLTIIPYSPPLGAINTPAVTINDMTYDFPIEITLFFFIKNTG